MIIYRISSVYKFFDPISFHRSVAEIASYLLIFFMFISILLFLINLERIPFVGHNRCIEEHLVSKQVTKQYSYTHLFFCCWLDEVYVKNMFKLKWYYYVSVSKKCWILLRFAFRWSITCCFVVLLSCRSFLTLIKNKIRNYKWTFYS